MAGLEAGKPFTNLKIEVPNDMEAAEEGEVEDEEAKTRVEQEEEMEEGEASDDEVEVNVIINPPVPPPSSKLMERVKRFGAQDKDAPTPEAVNKLYRSLGITSNDFARGHFVADALHVRGMGQLASRDVLNYFLQYHPANVEWVDKHSCNVVWEDTEGPLRALLGLSCPITPRRKPVPNSTNGKKTHEEGEGKVGHKVKVKKEKKDRPKPKKTSSSSSSSSDSSSSDSSSSDSEGSSSSSSNSSSGSSSSSSSSSDSGSDSNNDTEAVKEKKPKKKKKKSKIKVEKMEEDGGQTATVEDKDEVSVKEEDVGMSVPSGRWRLGVPCQRTRAVLIRYCSRSDKKAGKVDRKVERISDRHHSRSYGVKGILSESAKRRMREANRMGAPIGVGDLDNVGGPCDYRGEDENSKNPWGALAQNWGRKESQEDDRLNYQELLQQHRQRGTMGGKRKRHENVSEEEIYEDDYQYQRDKRRRRRRSCDDHNNSQDSDDSDVVPWKSKIKIPRMKMYADAEQKKTKRRKSGDLWTRLSDGDGGGDRKRGGIQDRLSHPKGNHGSIKSRLDLRAKLSRKKRNRNNVNLDNDRYQVLVASDED